MVLVGLGQSTHAGRRSICAIAELGRDRSLVQLQTAAVATSADSGGRAPGFFGRGNAPAAGAGRARGGGRRAAGEWSRKRLSGRQGAVPAWGGYTMAVPLRELSA